MKQTINKTQFVSSFADMNRTENFTIEGREALFERLTEVEEDTGKEIELDPIAICCEWEEHKTPLEAIEDIAGGIEELDIEEDDEPEDVQEKAGEWLQERTTVIEHESGIVIQKF